MPHDDDVKCKRFQTNGNNSQNIMSRMLDHNTHPWSWSPCSKYYVTDFLEWVFCMSIVHCVCCVNDQPSAINGNWSCSFFFCILRRGHGHCMRDKPVRDLTENTTSTSTFVGEYINPDKQCELVFGRTSIVCPYMPPCGRLWCGDDISGCRTQHMPWADGSICGEGLWCQRGQCIAINREALMKIDGAWGPWSR